MGAWLLSIALDLLTPAFVACACYPAPLLEWLWLRRLAVGEFTRGRGILARVGTILVLRRFVLTRLAGACRKSFSCGKGWRSHGDSWGTWLWLGDAAPKSKWVG